MPKRPEIGETGCYIYDLNQRGYWISGYIAEVPYNAAIRWVQAVSPEAKMGCGFRAMEMVEGGRSSQWLNKLYVIVGHDKYEDKMLALYNHDGTIWLHRIEPLKG